jgi:hypothetical protein
VRIRGLRVRKSREERGALERQGSSTASGGGGGGTRDEELPHALKVKVKPHPTAQAEGAPEAEHAAMILLPLDYSGMAEEEGECLLKAMDVQVGHSHKPSQAHMILYNAAALISLHKQTLSHLFIITPCNAHKPSQADISVFNKVVLVTLQLSSAFTSKL